MPNLYAKKLVEEAIWKNEDIDKIANSYKDWLNENLKEVEKFIPEVSSW